MKLTPNQALTSVWSSVAAADHIDLSCNSYSGFKYYMRHTASQVTVYFFFNVCFLKPDSCLSSAAAAPSLS